jgi:DNA invertase Pin-like site-specific DNA recombinase
MNAQPVRAIGYARVSRQDEQDILANQVERIRDYASRFPEISLEKVYEEVASGGKDNRSVLNEVMSRVTTRGGPKIVLFTSLSRMTRGGVGSALLILNRLKESGCGWMFADQTFLNFDGNTPPLARDILLGVLAAVDEDYRRNISTKTKAAYAKRKALAAAQGYTLAWGKRGPGKKKRVPPQPTSPTEIPAV